MALLPRLFPRISAAESVGGGNVSKRPILSTQRFLTCYRRTNEATEVPLSHEVSRSYSIYTVNFYQRIDRRRVTGESRQADG
jgi:hypothetical protein